jgi:hypothetical protein
MKKVLLLVAVLALILVLLPFLTGNLEVVVASR